MSTNNHLGEERAQVWLDAARSAVELYDDHPGVAFSDLAAEVATEVRLLRAVQAEVTVHAAARESSDRWVRMTTANPSSPNPSSDRKAL